MRKDTSIFGRLAEGTYAGKPCAFWFWETEPENMRDDRIREVMVNGVKELGYGGFSIIANKLKGYLSDAYFQKYRVAVETAEQLGINLCIYDENGFPSGAANGAFGEKYPAHTVKRLDKKEWDFPHVASTQQIDVPLELEGTVMSVVLMNDTTKECVDVTDSYTNGRIQTLVPAGSWKLMAFVCVVEGSPVVDYLCAASVKQFMDMTHEAYYREFAPYFGNVIDSFFYDEPSMWGFEGPWIPGGRIVTEGRMWTPGFNAFFETMYGESPALDYPALWYDIGERTEHARYRLFKCRSEMFNQCYIQQMGDWCEEKGVLLTGHTWEENILNPSGTIGDLMKVFKHQQIPGIDSIAEYQYVKTSVKIVSSSAYNWDKPLVMCETFGALPENERLRHLFYKETMDLYAKGVNYMIPHAVWYGPSAWISPNLSYGGPYTDILPDVMAYITRLNGQLQAGRHVADIAIVYPIEDMHAKYCFAQPNDPCMPSYGNYTEIGEKLSCDYRYDFTYLHPEIIEERCIVDATTRTLRLDNEANFENYRVLLFPGMAMVSLSVLKKAQEFYQQGGTVVFCGRVPEIAVDPVETPEVQAVIGSLFDGQPMDRPLRSHSAMGGTVCYLPTDSMDSLYALLKEVNGVPDVEIAPVEVSEDGTLTYIHKVKNERNIYFFANSSIHEVHTTVRVRGRLSLSCLDPHTGATETVAVTCDSSGAEEYTEFTLHLAPEKSLFFVEDNNG